jgi:hypothetical protein
METALPMAAQAAPQLDFAIDEVAPLEHAAVPTLRFALRVDSAGAAPVRSVALGVQIRIAATRRSYDARAQERLVELFGQPREWARNLHGLHWTMLNVQVPAFTGSTVADLLVPCSYDLEVTATRYFRALEDGTVPLEFLFSGSVFYARPDGRLQVDRIGQDREAGFRLPVAVWRDAMDRHFPGAGWLRLERDSFDRLSDYKARHAHLTWERAIDTLLREAGE